MLKAFGFLCLFHDPGLFMVLTFCDVSSGRCEFQRLQTPPWRVQREVFRVENFGLLLDMDIWDERPGSQTLRAKP